MSAPLTVAGLEQAAREVTGLADFGPDTGWREGFGRLVAAVEAMGPNDQLRHMAKHNIVGQLATRLRFVEDDRLHPEIAAQEVGDPLIVIGLPRTGTTISYDLLCLDPAARSPREWEWYIPWPPPQIASFDSDPRIAQVTAMYDNWLEHAPQLLDIQRFDCTQPGECNHGMQYHFGSTNFAAELGVPDFARWLRENEVVGQYASHKRLLQNFQWQGPKGPAGRLSWRNAGVDAPRPGADLFFAVELYCRISGGVWRRQGQDGDWPRCGGNVDCGHEPGAGGKAGSGD